MISDAEIDRDGTEMIGQRFGRLVVRAEAPRKLYRRWLCLCDCGKEHVVREPSLKNGHTQSCGCLGRERRLDAATKAKIKHGMSNTKTYRVWSSMMKRCRNPNDQRWAAYGGRGIVVCERWRKFPDFLADMGEKPDGMSLDRIDVNGNYEPSNCRWATNEEQSNNTRFNILLTHNGKTQTLTQWADEVGIRKQTLWARINRYHMPLEKALVVNDYRR